MRETINNILKFIEENCEIGRDDMEIAVLYSCVSSLYGALEAIKEVEDRYCDDCRGKEDYYGCMYED